MTTPFNGRQLLIARQFQALTQRELGERVAVAHSVIAHYEGGNREPAADIIVEALAAVLMVTPEYFYRRELPRFSPDDFNFRDQITASVRLRRRVQSYADYFARAVERVAVDVELPELSLPQTVQDPEAAAAEARTHWGISSQAPIGRMSRVLENAGIVITPLRFSPPEVSQVDALSGYNQSGVVLINVTKESTSRARFNMAHELAHGVLHRSRAMLPLAQKEAEANRFAGAFLLPRDSFSRDFRISGHSLDGLIELKLRWGVSIQAILMRAKDLGLIDAAELRVWFRSLSRHGWRKSEPAEPDPSSEYPELFEGAVGEWEALPAERLAKDLNWSLALVEQVTGLRETETPETQIADNVVSLTDRRTARLAAGGQ